MTDFKPALSSILVITFFFVALLVYTKMIGPIPFSLNSINTNKSDSFNVIGEGSVAVAPDIALLSVGITANASTVKAVQDEINSKINQVSESIKKLGIDSKDIKTSNYSVHPNIDYNSGNQKIVGYGGSTNLSIKIRDLEKVNQVIDTATATGANQVAGITFDVDDKTKAESEARQKAVTEAKKKAEDASKIAGFSLGRMINYSENFNGYPRPILMESKAVGALDSSPTSVEPGSSEIKVIVTLSYEIL
ncbi:MAG: SIMPL domain-containing protein [Candidatus Daviesbacteria bacterium]